MQHPGHPAISEVPEEYPPIPFRRHRERSTVRRECDDPDVFERYRQHPCVATRLQVEESDAGPRVPHKPGIGRPGRTTPSAYDPRVLRNRSILHSSRASRSATAPSRSVVAIFVPSAESANDMTWRPGSPGTSRTGTPASRVPTSVNQSRPIKTAATTPTVSSWKRETRRSDSRPHRAEPPLVQACTRRIRFSKHRFAPMTRAGPSVARGRMGRPLPSLRLSGPDSNVTEVKDRAGLDGQTAQVLLGFGFVFRGRMVWVLDPDEHTQRRVDPLDAEPALPVGDGLPVPECRIGGAVALTTLDRGTDLGSPRG